MTRTIRTIVRAGALAAAIGTTGVQAMPALGGATAPSTATPYVEHVYCGYYGCRRGYGGYYRRAYRPYGGYYQPYGYYRPYGGYYGYGPHVGLGIGGIGLGLY